MSDTDASAPNKRTALVTGASSGLGREFAKLFARDKHDVIVVARGEKKLRELAAELAQSGVTAHVVPADLSTREGASKLCDDVDKLGVPVDFLVNNAGFGSNGAFADIDLARELEMVQVNIASLIQLTHHFLAPMHKRGFGRVLNIASTAGFQAGPYMATYYASKAFVVSFSEAVAHEVREHNRAGGDVSVTCHCPGATATEFSSAAGTSDSKLFKRGGVASAVDVATHAYRAMMKRQVLAVHGAANWIAMESVRFAPRAMVRGIAAGLNRP
ncbi:MAG TPA: SDR family oxidoreductase [Myxococcota bacterium]|jgi:hypothetical protein